MSRKPFCGVKCRRAWYVKWPKDCVSISAVRWPPTVSSRADECSSAQLKNTVSFFGKQKKKSSFCLLKKEVDSTRRQTLGPCRYRPAVLIKPLSSQAGSLDLCGTMDKGVRLQLQGTCTLTHRGRKQEMECRARPAWHRAAGDPAAGRAGRGRAGSTASLPRAAKG